MSGTYVFLVFQTQWWMQIKEISLFEAGFVLIGEELMGVKETGYMSG